MNTSRQRRTRVRMVLARRTARNIFRHQTEPSLCLPHTRERPRQAELPVYQEERSCQVAKVGSRTFLQRDRSAASTMPLTKNGRAHRFRVRNGQNPKIRPRSSPRTRRSHRRQTSLGLRVAEPRSGPRQERPRRRGRSRPPVFRKPPASRHRHRVAGHTPRGLGAHGHPTPPIRP